MTEQQLLDTLHSQGLNLIPINKETKIPLVPWKKYQKERFEREIYPNSNLGIICGAISDNLVVIDIDHKDKSWIEKIVPNALEKTLVVKTYHGHHIYLKTDQEYLSERFTNDEIHIDTKSRGAYVVGPSSTHPSGTGYKIISETSIIGTFNFDEIKNNIKQLGFVKETSGSGIRVLVSKGVKEGSRNESIFKLAQSLLNDDVSDDMVWDTIATVNQKNDPPVSKKELNEIFKSAKKYQTDDELDPAMQILNLATSKIKKLVISQNNPDDVYAVVNINNHIEVLNLSSKRAVHWLMEVEKETTEITVRNNEFYKNILNRLIAQAQINNTAKEKIHKRIAFSDDKIIYDLGRTDWQVVTISSTDIQTLPITENMPLFDRSQSVYEQVLPVFDNKDALEELTTLLRIENKLLFKVHLVSFFLSKIASPLMVLDGPAGSMKSSATSAVSMIVDPSGSEKDDNCDSMATKKEDLIIQLFNRYMSSFDNVSKISKETSDVLCRAITGANNPRRKLYSDTQEKILRFKSKIVLNGILPHTDYTDLQSRSIHYDRTPPTETERLSDEEFWSKINELLPSLLGQIFTILQKALQIYPSLKKEIRPKTRMADFEIWGAAITKALGEKTDSFLEEYHTAVEVKSIETKESHPIVKVVELLLKDKTAYEDTVSNSYSIFKKHAETLGFDIKSRYVRFPKAVNQLRYHINEAMPILQQLGYSVEISPYTKNDGTYVKNSRILKITKPSGDLDQYSVSQ